MTTKITINVQGESIYAAAAGYLGDSFWAFKSACTNVGARWNRERGADARYVTPAIDAPRLINSLCAAGFDVRASTDAAKLIQAAGNAADAAAGAKETRTDDHISGLDLPLYPYQRDGIKFLRSRGAALLADDMGLGKTIQALAAIPLDGCALVICPAGVKSVWVAECKKWRPDLTPVVLKGRKSFRWPEAGELVITNPDILIDEVPVAVQGTIVIADEAHMFKGSAKKVARVRRFRAITRAVRDAGGKTWLLTGTPMKNRPTELWNLLTSAGLHKEAYGNWFSFMNAFNGYKGRFGMEWGDPTPLAAAGLAKVSLRRAKTDVLTDLPSKRTERVPVAIGSLKLADEVMRDLPEAFDLTHADLQALKSTISFEKISAARAALAKAKIPALLEHVVSYEEAETPVVVFSAHRAPIDALATRDGWAVITGDTPSDERGRIQERFQAGKLRGIAGTYGAMGTGVTLTAASDMLLCDLPWTPADLTQAMDRIYRIGQKNACLYKVLDASHDLDNLVNRLILDKSELIQTVVEATNDTTGKGNVPTSTAGARAKAALAKVTISDVVDAPESTETKTKKGHKIKQPTTFTTTQIDWACDGLTHLSAVCDGAVTQDGCGFNGTDSHFGRSLASSVQNGGLSSKQLEFAVKMLKKYHGQIGAFPS